MDLSAVLPSQVLTAEVLAHVKTHRVLSTLQLAQLADQIQTCRRLTQALAYDRARQGAGNAIVGPNNQHINLLPSAFVAQLYNRGSTNSAGLTLEQLADERKKHNGRKRKRPVDNVDAEEGPTGAHSGPKKGPKGPKNATHNIVVDRQTVVSPEMMLGKGLGKGKVGKIASNGKQVRLVADGSDDEEGAKEASEEEIVSDMGSSDTEEEVSLQLSDDSEQEKKKKKGKKGTRKAATPSESENDSDVEFDSALAPRKGSGNAAARLQTFKLVKLPAVMPNGEEVCHVCGDGDSDEGNDIVYCDGCDACVHQRCYAIAQVPDGQWHCDACTAKQNKKKPLCAVCPVVGGIHRKVTSLGDVLPPEAPRRGPKRDPGAHFWAHVACALWTPNVTFGDPANMSDIRVDALTADYMALKCTECKQAGGGVMQCAHTNCSRAFHPLCARSKGFVMEFSTKDQDVAEPMGFCQGHSAPRFAASRDKILHGIVTDEQQELAILDNTARQVARTPAPLETVNEYEQQRKRNIERNQERLKQLMQQED